MKKVIFSLKYIATVCAFLTAFQSDAQQNEGPGVGMWRNIFSYYQATALATDQETYFCGTSTGFFTYNNANQSLDAYSKANGMSDIDVAVVAHDLGSGYTLIGYSNSNIDLFKDGSFINIPDVKISTILADKSFNDAIAHLGYVYISSNMGLITVNLNKQEIKETIPFYQSSVLGAVNCVAIKDNMIFAATSVGVFKTNINNPQIQNYLTWAKISEKNYTKLRFSEGNLFASTNGSVFLLDADTGEESTLFTTARPIRNISKAIEGNIWVLQKGGVDGGYGDGKSLLLSASGSALDSINCFYPMSICQSDNGVVWLVDSAAAPDYGGLHKRNLDGTKQIHTPSGAVTNSFFDVLAEDGSLWVAHGSVAPGTWRPLNNYNMFSHYANGTWTNYNGPVRALDVPFLQDIIRVSRNPINNSLLFSSAHGGIIQRLNDGTLKSFKTGYFEPVVGDTNQYKVIGIAVDDKGTAWMANFGAANELKAVDKDGNWYKFHADGNSTRGAADLVIDDYGQKWYVAGIGGGLVVYDDNGTLANRTDDRSRVLKTGKGNGNLPDNTTLCIAKDKDGAIWVGTNDGIGIVSCPGEVINRQCEGELRAVIYEGQTSANYLFKGLAVTAIAVDGANRKWIGTNNGVWLISDDAEDIIYKFTAEDSPLPSNAVHRINIDPVNGDVYFSTDKGLAVFRSTATEGSAENADELLIYPNPVPSGFSGQIAIRGVAENSDVRITDINGQLVYRTIALGGQAVWDGNDYLGKRAQSGVYLVFVTNKDGTQKTTGKFIFHN
jgi:hypothetical protein